MRLHIPGCGSFRFGSFPTTDGLACLLFPPSLQASSNNHTMQRRPENDSDQRLQTVLGLKVQSSELDPYSLPLCVLGESSFLSQFFHCITERVISIIIIIKFKHTTYSNTHACTHRCTHVHTYTSTHTGTT